MEKDQAIGIIGNFMYSVDSAAHAVICALNAAASMKTYSDFIRDNFPDAEEAEIFDGFYKRGSDLSKLIIAYNAGRQGFDMEDGVLEEILPNGSDLGDFTAELNGSLYHDRDEFAKRRRIEIENRESVKDLVKSFNASDRENFMEIFGECIDFLERLSTDYSGHLESRNNWDPEDEIASYEATLPTEIAEREIEKFRRDIYDNIEYRRARNHPIIGLHTPDSLESWKY